MSCSGGHYLLHSLLAQPAQTLPLACCAAFGASQQPVTLCCSGLTLAPLSIKPGRFGVLWPCLAMWQRRWQLCLMPMDMSKVSASPSDKCSLCCEACTQQRAQLPPCHLQAGPSFCACAHNFSDGQGTMSCLQKWQDMAKAYLGKETPLPFVLLGVHLAVQEKVVGEFIPESTDIGGSWQSLCVWGYPTGMEQYTAAASARRLALRGCCQPTGLHGVQHHRHQSAWRHAGALAGVRHA